MLGICGGYQMLGAGVADPDGIEGPPGEVQGLGLLDVATVLAGDKTLREVEGTSVADGAPFRGYEMHVGRTGWPRLRPAAAALRGRARRGRGLGERARMAAPMSHGLFADDAQRAAWLAALGASSDLAYEPTVEATLDALADHLEAYLDLDAMLAAAR